MLIFFVDGLSGIERANLVRVCIKKLYDAVVSITSLICDGPSSHFSMMSALGANLDPLNIQAFFTHPLRPEKRCMFYWMSVTC